MAKIIRWTDTQRDAVFSRLHRIHSSTMLSFESCLRMAEELELPADKRHQGDPSDASIINLKSQFFDWFFETEDQGEELNELEHLAQLIEKKWSVLVRSDSPEAFLESLQAHMQMVPRTFIREGGGTKLSVVTSTPKDRPDRPKILVCGIKPKYAASIEAQFPGADITFMYADSKREGLDTTRLRQVAQACDKCIIMHLISHSDLNIVTSVVPAHKRTHCSTHGVSSLTKYLDAFMYNWDAEKRKEKESQAVPKSA